MKRVLVLATVLCLLMLSTMAPAVQSSGLYKNETSSNIKLIRQKVMMSTYLYFRSRVWAVDDVADNDGRTWYIISMETNGINDKVRCKFLAHEILVWSTTDEVQYLPKTLRHSNNPEEGWISAYAPIYKYEDYKEWWEDVKTGIYEYEQPKAWGWVDDEGRFESEYWRFYRSKLLDIDIWLWEEDTKVKDLPIDNFETLLICKSKDLSVGTKYIYDEVGVSGGQHVITDFTWRLDSD